MKKLFCKIYASYLLVAGLTLTVLLVTAPLLLQKVVYKQAEEQLAKQARLFRRSWAETAALNNDALRKLCTVFSAELASRFTVISAAGEVLAESEKDPAELDNHTDRPEVEEALQGKTGISIRHSHTLDEYLLYLAVPLRKNGKIIGAARVSLPTTTLRKRQADLQGKLLFAALPALLFAAAVSLPFVFRMSAPLQEIGQGVLHFTQGRLDHRIRISGPPEIISLARLCNQMAAQLDEQTAALKKQLGLLESTFRSMNEAVLITDQEGRLLGGNQAAGRLFGFDPIAVGQRDIQELIRHADVQQFLDKTLKQAGATEELITFGRDREKICSAHGCLLRDGSGRRTGALLVFHDITRLKRLEDLRRDFAANVSHELRTPITAISGFVETLRDGAMHGPEAKRFLEIIARNVKRLQAIIEDLLTLARLEQEERQERIVLSKQAVRPVLQNAAAICAEAAGEKNIRLELRCPDRLTAEINPDLLEQAAVNLLDNAIKYSQRESKIILSASQDTDEVLICVQDFGCGISREHHSRLFERFYRVDKARSCKLGGTGLGLAIVKHIVNAHHGTISVDSRQGQGSTFSIRLLG
jgi:two-component system phosphate regulon sensor histidine kinase PhoR